MWERSVLFQVDGHVALLDALIGLGEFGVGVEAVLVLVVKIGGDRLVVRQGDAAGGLGLGACIQHHGYGALCRCAAAAVHQGLGLGGDGQVVFHLEGDHHFRAAVREVGPGLALVQPQGLGVQPVGGGDGGVKGPVLVLDGVGLDAALGVHHQQIPLPLCGLGLLGHDGLHIQGQIAEGVLHTGQVAAEVEAALIGPVHTAVTAGKGTVRKDFHRAAVHIAGEVLVDVDRHLRLGPGVVLDLEQEALVAVQQLVGAVGSYNVLHGVAGGL